MAKAKTRLAVPAATLIVLLTLAAIPDFAQTEAATISGRVADQTGAVVPGVTVRLQNAEHGTIQETTTNRSGIYVFPVLQPGVYTITVRKEGFRQVDYVGLTANTQAHIEQNFRLQLGAISESVTVRGDAVNVNTTDASVSTVIDRQFVENLPLNGRSFQTLINLTPGVVITASSVNDGGQFSVNGQRASSNYWMVDGVGANIGAAPSFVPGNGTGGALFGFSAQGGTNSLVSVDAMQEFRIQTSTYAPEFGRTPGGQISIVTRSGTSQFHGTVFDYFRNNVLDANDWFADHAGLAKPEERQNDFGGTFGGPILRSRTFFFFSYEGLRLRLPQVAQTFVPDLAARQSASTALQPFLNVFPLPNGPQAVDQFGPIAGAAQFNKSFSNKSTLDAYSLRIDHKLSSKLSLFGRYNYSPSENVARGQFAALSQLSPSDITTQTTTGGATWTVSPTLVNDFRLNYSRSNTASSQELDAFGGAVPLRSLPLPSGFTNQNAYLLFGIFSLDNNPDYIIGRTAHNLQRQVNLVENLSWQKGSHSLKFGVDYRRLTPVFDPPGYTQQDSFGDVPSAETGSPLSFFSVTSTRSEAFLFRNWGMFAQDTWKIIPRLTLTYGLRWDIDVAPATTSGPSFPAINNFNLNDLSTLALAPARTPPYKTPLWNFAPRIGGAYELAKKPGWERILRGGFGLFYDLATQEFGNNLNAAVYPFGAGKFAFGGSFPLDSASASPPAVVAPSASNPGPTFVFDPNLNLPYTLEWNLALQQGLGTQQTLTATYTGASGKRLIGTARVFSPNQTFSSVEIVSNAAISNYNALQLEFNRRLSHGLQMLASYTWSHSIDTGSASSLGNTANGVVPGINANQNRGDSDFDLRGKTTLGLTYDIPTPRLKSVAQTLLRGWSLETNALIQSAPPVNVYDTALSQVLNGSVSVRPDVVPGIPPYLYGSQYPGGRAINFTPGAVAGGCPDGSASVGPFCPPPIDSSSGFAVALRQGDLGRNALRGYRAAQWDFGVHREFPIRESLKMKFQAEMFNLLNHPNFAPPVADMNNLQSGQSAMTLGQYLGANVGSGGFNPLYQIGGPRSIQLALKAEF